MNPGILRHRITIQNLTYTQDDYGAPTEIWKTYHTCNASIEPLRGREFFAAQKENSEVTHKAIIRYKSGLKTSMRVNFNNRYFNIKSIINIEERNKEIHLMLTEVVE